MGDFYAEHWFVIIFMDVGLVRLFTFAGAFVLTAHHAAHEFAARLVITVKVIAAVHHVPSIPWATTVSTVYGVTNLVGWSADAPYTPAAPDVLGACDRLKMFRASTATITASVVKIELLAVLAVGDGTIGQLIDHAVNSCPGPAVPAGDSVAVLIASAGPQMAMARAVKHAE